MSFGDERISYRELNERVNRVGHYLRAQGMGPEALVGLMLERSVDMVVAVLATAFRRRQISVRGRRARCAAPLAAAPT